MSFLFWLAILNFFLLFVLLQFDWNFFLCFFKAILNWNIRLLAFDFFNGLMKH